MIGRTKYFGLCLPGSSWLDEAERTETPVGEKCARCEEEIIEGDAGIMTPFLREGGWTFLPQHYNCFLRSFIGSAAHIEGRCGCFIKGSEEGDDPALTKRQAADAAVEAFLGKSLKKRGGTS